MKKEKLTFYVWLSLCAIWLIVAFLRPDLLPDDKYYMGMINCMLQWIPAIITGKVWGRK